MKYLWPMALLFCAIPEYTETDNGKTLQMEPRRGFSIKLEENPSTGYVWYLQPYDKKVLYHQEWFLEKKSKEPKVGSPRTVFYEFSSIKKGETEVRFEYRGPGRNSKVEKRLSFKVKVE